MHAHSDWRNTGVFAYATGKSYSITKQKHV